MNEKNKKNRYFLFTLADLMEADLYEGTGDGHLIRAGVGGGRSI